MEKNENGYTRQRESTCSDGLQLGMVYSPYNSWRMLLSAESALKHGTLFEELYKPLREVCDE
jgi:hypothetical protein